MSITLSAEQFDALMSRLTLNQPPVATPVAVSGNFTKCSSRFDGSKDADVNAFLDAIEIYKDCTQMTNDNALKGLPMLLDGFAATWYQGVKSTLHDWDEAVSLLRPIYIWPM